MKDFSLRDFLLGGVVFTAVLNALGKRRYGLLIFLILVTVILTILYLVYRIIKFLLFEAIPAAVAGVKEGIEESRTFFADPGEKGLAEGQCTSPKNPIVSANEWAVNDAESASITVRRSPCPRCAESIVSTEVVCRFCGHTANSDG